MTLVVFTSFNDSMIYNLKYNNKVSKGAFFFFLFKLTIPYESNGRLKPSRKQIDLFPNHQHSAKSAQTGNMLSRPIPVHVTCR